MIRIMAILTGLLGLIGCAGTQADTDDIAEAVMFGVTQACLPSAISGLPVETVMAEADPSFPVYALDVPQELSDRGVLNIWRLGQSLTALEARKEDMCMVIHAGSKLNDIQPVAAAAIGQFGGDFEEIYRDPPEFGLTRTTFYCGAETEGRAVVAAIGGRAGPPDASMLDRLFLATPHTLIWTNAYPYSCKEISKGAIVRIPSSEER